MYQLTDQIPGIGLYLLLFSLLATVPIAFLLTWVLMWFLRTRIDKANKATAGADDFPEESKTASLESPANLEIILTRASSDTAKQARSKELILSGRRSARQLARITAIATASYVLILALFMTAEYASPGYKLWQFALLAGVFFLAHSTPIALSWTMMLRRQPRYLILAALLVVFSLWVIEVNSPFETLDLWLWFGGLPTVIFLLLNGRRLRASGPIVFSATSIALFGFIAGYAASMNHYFETVGPITFAREDLAGLPLLEAGKVWWSELLKLPLPELQIVIANFIQDPLATFNVANLEAETTALELQSRLIQVSGLILGIFISWMFVRWFARNYRDRRASERMLGTDILMFIFAFPLLLIMAMHSFLWVSGILVGLLIYKLIFRWRLKNRDRSVLPADSRTLLMLRVFGYDRRTQRLLEDIVDRWRFLGPTRLLGASDVVHTVIEPDDFYAFLNGKLGEEFIRNEEGLNRRIANTQPLQDPDGSYRVDEFYCHADTWRMAVSRLALQADAVFMDLRGFNSTNEGCMFEIEQLLAFVPAQRITLLIDKTSDQVLLEQTLNSAVGNMPRGSPNAAGDNIRIKMLRCSKRYSHTLNTLMGSLCESMEPFQEV